MCAREPQAWYGDTEKDTHTHESGGQAVWGDERSTYLVVGVVVQRPGPAADARRGVGRGAAQGDQGHVAAVGELVLAQVPVLDVVAFHALVVRGYADVSGG